MRGNEMESRERWTKRTFTVFLDEGTYGDSPDEEEVAYLLRMGGIDADTITGHQRYCTGCAECCEDF